MHFKLNLYCYVLSILKIICFSSSLFAGREEDLQALKELTFSLQSFSQKSSPTTSSPKKDSNRYLNDAFRTWDNKDHSVIQIHVLDQFLTVEQFTLQRVSLEKMPKLNILFNPQQIYDPMEIEEASLQLSQIQEAEENINKKINQKEILPYLNIGGGEESCGYQAVKNAMLISQNLEVDPLIYFKLNDLFYANKLFGTEAINKLLNISDDQGLIDVGPWRKEIIDHRIALIKLSLNNFHNKAKKTLADLDKDINKLTSLLESYKAANTEETKQEIISVWDNIKKHEDKVDQIATDARYKAQEFGNKIETTLDMEISIIATHAKNLVDNTKKIIPEEIIKPKFEEFDEEDWDEGSLENEEEEDEELDFDDEEEEDEFLDEESGEKEKNPELLETPFSEPTTIDETSFNLEQSEREGNYLKDSDIDYLYELLSKEFPTLSESTTIGASELGVEPSESGEKIESEIAEELFNRIITSLSQDSSKQHVLFIAGGAHWVSVVIKIINNKLYYIIADSTNELRYGVDLKQKGIFITKAIQKIIDGTKDKLVQLTR